MHQEKVDIIYQTLDGRKYTSSGLESSKTVQLSVNINHFTLLDHLQALRIKNCMVSDSPPSMGYQLFAGKRG